MCGLGSVGCSRVVVVGWCGVDGCFGCVDVGCFYGPVGVLVVVIVVVVDAVVGGAPDVVAVAVAVVVVAAAGCSRRFVSFLRGEVVVGVASSGELVCVCASPKASCRVRCAASFLGLRLGFVCTWL